MGVNQQNKLHIGSGTVYLRNWINVDLPADRTFLAIERYDLVEKLITDESDYYGRHHNKTVESLRKGPLRQESVCDRYGSFEALPARTACVIELLARHCFEHLSGQEAHRALLECRRVLAPRGLLRLDVPDHDATYELGMKTGDPFYKRHLLGPRRDDDPYGYHMKGYTREGLRLLVEEHDFEFEDEEVNIHFYPAFCLRFHKR